MAEKKMNLQGITNAQIQLMRMGEFGEYIEINNELQPRVKVFEAVIWFPHLQSQVNASNSRGMSAELRGMKIMTWCSAGRCLIGLREGEHSITLITADDEAPWGREMAHVAPMMGPMGIQSLNGTYIEILKLLHKATKFGLEIKLVANPNVTIFTGD